jgi:ElaB/YqjD/DUF883 family membrane-anchored ribosome-binding protein
MNSGKVSSPGSQNEFSSSSKRSGAGGSGTDIRGKAADAGSKLAGVAQQTMDEAKRATSSLASDANERVKSLLDQQVAAGADLMSNVAESVRVAADNLEPRIPQLANVARDASERIEAFSRDVRQQSASELAQAVAEFARRRPAVVFGVAAALGFVGFRLLNASPGISDHRNRSATDWRPEPRLGDSAYPVASPMNAGSARYSPATSTTAPGVHSQGVGGYPAGSSTNPQGSMSNPTGTPSKVSTENAPPISPSPGQFHGA